MKRIILCLTIFLLFTGCTSSKSTKSYIEINYTELNQKLENKDTFALYIGSATCTHCQELKPILEKVITDYDLEIYYIDLNKFDLKNEEERTQYNDVWDSASLTGTPTIVFITEGKINLFPRIIGTVSETTLISQLKSAGYIG